MTNTQKLKQYLLDQENAFLLDKNNNGKTIMLSGAWGAGKTHFWQNEIEPALSEKLEENDKACVYVSLYGKDNLNALKQEVFIKASSKNKLLSEEVSIFGFDVLSSIKDSDLKIGSIAKAFYGLNKARKKTLGENRLKDGGVICFDDFERKSQNIDLNDLFGFISQLAIDMQCKVIIILNSDVFECEEAEVFKRVKEKTVNKFLYFKPTIEELFESIYSDNKYLKLKDYKSDILNAIKEAEELNARLYIQVLDNCLEWADSHIKLDDNVIRVLILTTINFILNHIILDYKEVIFDKGWGNINYNFTESYPSTIFKGGIYNFDATPTQFEAEDKNSYLLQCRNVDYTEFIDDIKKNIFRVDTSISSINSNSKSKTFTHSSTRQDEYSKWLENNTQELKALWKYGYRLYYVGDVDKETYEDIAEFVKTGILLSRLTHEL